MSADKPLVYVSPKSPMEPVEWDAPFTGATRMGLYNELFVSTRLMIIDMVERGEHCEYESREPFEDVFRVINALNAIEEGTINAE